MVEHCSGPKSDGDFVHTLTLTDIASGWTECVAMPLRNQSLIVESLIVAQDDLSFAMLGINTDNDSAFMNQTVFDHCKAKGLEQMGSRAYKKNDQALGRAKERCHRLALGRIWPPRTRSLSFMSHHGCISTSSNRPSSSRPRRATGRG
jgi:hypothetical protein